MPRQVPSSTCLASKSCGTHLLPALHVGFQALRKKEKKAMSSDESFYNPTCADQVDMPERELESFIAAVKELHGPELALLSADDWLKQSEQMDISPRSTIQDWRAVTVAAAARLSDRLTGARDHRAFR